MTEKGTAILTRPLMNESFTGDTFARTESRAGSSGRNGRITTGAKAIVWSLEELGVTDIFGIPGGNVMPLYDALIDSSALRHILTRHEQGAGHAAAGYAAASGRVGVTIATSGPGATNLLTAIADAYFSSISMLIITGQVSSALIGTDAFQEADIIGMTTSITKHSFLVTSAEDIAPTLAEAHLIASTGRPGPVLVDITKDAQQASVMFQSPGNPRLPGYRPKTIAHKGQISSAAQLVRQSQRPVLFIGGGVIKADAATELGQLVQLTGIPVVTTPNARGTFPEADERHLGISGRHGTDSAFLALKDSDLVLAIGTGLSERSTGNPAFFAPKAKLIHADIDPTEISKVRIADVSIVGDAKEIIRSLTETLAGDERNRPNLIPRPKRSEDSKGHLTPGREPEDGGLLSPPYVIERIGALTGADGIYVAGAGEHQAWAARHIECNHPKSWLNSASPGYGVPAAMGAKVAQPDHKVWAIDSDAGFQMTNQELATCTVNHIPIKVAILNTGKSGQGQDIADRSRQTIDVNTVAHPDFVKLANAFGALAIRVSKPDEVDAAIMLALDTNDRTVVIDFAVPAGDVPLRLGGITRCGH